MAIVLHADHDQVNEDEGKITLMVTSLPRDRSVSLKQVETYLVKQGNRIRVHSKTWVGGQKAQLELSGVATQGV